MKCCICGEEIDIKYSPDGKTNWSKGHNAEPVMTGRCCTVCNDGVVLPIRLGGRFKDVFTKNFGVVDK